MKRTRIVGVIMAACVLLVASPLAAQTGSDAFAGRPALTQAGGVASGTGSNAAASAEQGEPAHLGTAAVRSLWWQWTAPASGLVQVDTIGTTFNTRLAVYTGAVLRSLERLASNLSSDDAPNFESVVRFQAVAGSVYAIAVDGYTDPESGATETGVITLNMRQPGPGAPPANDLFNNAAVLASAAVVAATGTVVGASVEAGEPDPEATADPLGPARTVWFSWTAPSTGFFTMQIEADEIAAWEPVASVYVGSTVSELAVMDQAEVLAFVPVNFTTGLVTATFPATAGQTYRIQVGALAFLTSIGAFNLTLGPAARPLQDDFAQAGDAGSAMVYAGDSSLIEATRETGEPNHFAPVGIAVPLSSATVWWKWTAPAAGPVTVDTRGSDGDTVLAVYRSGNTPATLAGLVLVSANDDINFNWNALSSVSSFSAAAGTEYYFAVTGYSQSSRLAFHLTTGARRTPYEAWRLGFPALNGAAAEPDADPDGDGLTNLQELVHGTHPLVASYASASERTLLPTLLVEGGRLVLECGYSNANVVGLSDGAGNGGLPIIVDARRSPDLKAWTPVPDADLGFGTLFAYASIPLGAAPAQSLRFEIIDPNP